MFKFFWALALEKTQIWHDLPPGLSRILCSSLFVDDLFSVCFQEGLCISFSLCSSLDICLFIYVFSCSLSRSFHRILPILVSSLIFLCVFLDSLYVFYFLFFWSLGLFLFILFSLKTISPQTWIITISSRWQSFSSTGIVALQVGYDLQNTKNYYSTANSPIIIVRVAYNLLTRLHIIMPTWSSRAKCLTVCPRYFTLRLDTRICACALPSPSPFHYVMAQLFPVVQLAAHAKSSTMYGRS